MSETIWHGGLQEMLNQLLKTVMKKDAEEINSKMNCILEHFKDALQFSNQAIKHTCLPYVNEKRLNEESEDRPCANNQREIESEKATAEFSSKRSLQP
ncbi:RNA1 polyprotein [Trichinella spiralis]|uniref:RNA1 polyprotein n=1 Tax=Trichinella spiralis TaxID=6334 RepID=A0ABR3K303_TRISP